MTLKKGFLFQVEKQRFNNLFFRNFCASMLIAVFLTTFFGAYTYYTGSQDFYDEIHNKRQNSLHYVKSVIDDTIMSMDKIAIYTKMQSSAQRFILDAQNDNNVLNEIKQYVKNYTAIYQYIDSIYIYSEGKDEIFSSANEQLKTLSAQEFEDLKWIEYYKKIDANEMSIFEHKCNDGRSYFITIVRPVSFNGKDKVGAVIMNLNVMAFAEFLNYENIGENIFLISKDGNIILSRDKFLIFKNVKDNQEYKNLMDLTESKTQTIEIQGEKAYTTTIKSSYNDWNYVIYDYTSQYGAEWTAFFWQFMKVCIVFFVLSLLVTYFLTMRNYKPLKNILTFLDNTGDKKEEEEEMRKGAYYSDKLASFVMNNKTKADEELMQQFVGYNKAQIMALQSQIKAHFLYNMLSTIQWHAFDMTETENDVSVMIYKLGEFFKTSMEINTSVLSIEEEIANARLYIELMQLRYEDVFSVHWDIDNNVFKYKTINICLQPLIENSIEHGLRWRTSKGKLMISARTSGEMIELVVADDGVGMDADKVSELNRMLESKTEYQSEHVGIINVCERLKFMFGNESSVKIESKPDVGTVVTLRIPKIL